MVSRDFFSTELHISLTFYTSGGLTGFVNFKNDLGYPTKHVKGLYIKTNELRIMFSFFSVQSKTLTAYSGEIFKYLKKEECMFLKYWALNESLADNFFEPQHLLLFDDPKKDFKTEKKKVIIGLPDTV